jgi:purine-nucleoside phosphorylase
MKKFENIFDLKHYQEASVFRPENLLREGRRQKDLPQGSVPEICLLDPDGDIVQYLKKHNKAEPNKCWACYHTRLYDFAYEGIRFGIIGNAVGAPFAVLLAEQLFVSGCALLISITSAGQITDSPDLPRFMVIEKALRDEGTSYHYLPPDTPYSYLDERILVALRESIFPAKRKEIGFGTSWTTDAPYRETTPAIDQMKRAGIDCVEMESSALYAFAQTKKAKVVCIAHLTNNMAQAEGDFEKGEEFGGPDSLRVIKFIAESIQ